MINLISDALIDQYLERERLGRFLDEAIQANQKYNLFSRNLKRRDLELMSAESLIPLQQGWITNHSGPILDVGSGWGIPAVPLLLSGLKIQMTLLERSRKKADFLYLLLHRLNLSAGVVCEDLGSYHHEQKYTLAFFRGVAVDKKLRRHLEKIIKPGGSIIYFGTNFPAEWMPAAQSLDYSIDNLPARKLIKYLLQ